MRSSITDFLFLISVFLATCCLASSQATAAESDTVMNPSKRQEALIQAKELLSEKTATVSGKNPFNPEGFGDTAPTPSQNQGATVNPIPAGPRSEKDLLQTIATGLKPNLMVLGGQPVLVFGQKRVKAGSFLTITFEGSEYNLEVVSIERPNFTLRLNREEFTRPIK